jgi:hypothetical protein
VTIGGGAFLFAASVLAGAVNAVAGGGSLLSFPAAMAVGLPSIVANATNAAALMPGSLASAWTYRRNLVGLQRLTVLLCVPAMVGALIGAAILRHTSQQMFDAVVPLLVAGATLLILAHGLVARLLRTPPSDVVVVQGSSGWLAVALVCQLLVSIYGGYFGAAMGIIMLAYLGLLGATGRFGLNNLHQMNGVKNILAVVINGSAAIDFIVHGLVEPRAALIMGAGGIAGGIAGARLARRTDPRHVRRLVVVIGFALASWLAYRRYV